jgi:hypothetical protein
MNWLYIFSLLVVFSGGYLTSTFLANRGSLEPHGTQTQVALTHDAPTQSKQMQTMGGMPTSQRAEPKTECQCLETEAEPFEEELTADAAEQELLLGASDKNMYSQVEREWAITEELERIELEHGLGQADDLADDTAIELSEEEIEYQRLDLDEAIEVEMELREFDIAGNDQDAGAYGLPPDLDGTVDEVEIEYHRLELENATAIRKELR